MSNKYELPKDRDLAGKIISANTEHENRKLERGYIGAFFGLSKEKPGNIAGATVILSFIFLAVILIWMPEFSNSTISKRDLLAVFAGFISTSLGFLFWARNELAILPNGRLHYLKLPWCDKNIVAHPRAGRPKPNISPIFSIGFLIRIMGRVPHLSRERGL